MTLFTDGWNEGAAAPSLLDAPRGYGDTLSTVASESFFGMSRDIADHPAEAPVWDEQIAKPPTSQPDDNSGLFSQRLKNIENYETEAMPPPAAVPMLSADAARDKIKASGLDGQINLSPEQKEFNPAQIDLMIRHGQHRAEVETQLARGPQGIVSTALTGTTSFLVGAADPINIAAAFIPVIGEARYAKLLESAGESALARAGVRVGVGAASGAVFGAAMTPIDYLNHTRDGQDYGMAEILRNMAFYTALGGGLHAGGGAVADIWRSYKGKPLYPFAPGEPHGENLALPEIGKEGPSVYNDVLSQLKASGMDDEAAAHNAAIFDARYKTRADRLGLSPDQAFDLYRNENVEIRSGDENAQAAARAYAQKHGLEGQMDLAGTEKIGDGDLAQRRADAPLKPKADQKAMDEGLFGDSAAQKSFFQSAPTAPTFYSALDNAVMATKQEKASPEQWIGTMKNTPGVKAEELDWLGVEDWLKEQKGAVTKQQLQDYIRANQVEVKEVEKDGGAWTFDHDEDAGNYVVYDASGKEFGRYDKSTTAQAVINSKQSTKFQSYQLPGGDNYREMLLTLPAKPHLSSFEEYLAAYRKRFPDNGVEDWEVKRYYERGALIPGEGKLTAKTDPGIFKSSHFDEPNVLAHVRFNDRVIDGKKTLFIEEVQSDWHQKGKREGYAKDTNGWTAQPLSAPDAGFTHWQINDANGNHITKIVGGSAESAIRKAAEGIPDAPFKTTWPELALKRMIRYAAENGYEKIGWTTGEQQAARYDLSKQIGRLALYEQRGELFLSAWKPNNGDNVMDLKSVTKEELPDLIGKEAADKLLKVKPDRSGHRTLEGVDLKVGGEGMKGFYDQILPSTANKLVKKFGGKVSDGSVEQTKPVYKYFGPDLSVDEFWDRSNKLRSDARMGEQIVKIRQRLQNGDSFADAMAQDGSEHLAEKLGGRIVYTTEKVPEKVHTLDLTPELKQAVLEKGQPLFQKNEAGDTRGRISFGENKKVIELFKSADESTFMHEAGHLWLDELARDAGIEDAPAQIRDDMASVREWLGAKDGEEFTVEQHERWARGFEQYLADGNAPSKALQSTFERFKDWLKSIYQNLRQLGAPISDDIRGVMDRMLATDRDIAARMADLPPRAQEDSLRMAIANIIQGEPVKVSEMLEAAAKADPRIAESLAPAPVIKRAAIPKKKAPVTLFRFLATKGGLKPDAELETILGGKNPFIPGYGRLVRKGGMALDRARELAVEAGYFHDAAEQTGLPSESTIRELLDAIDDESRGSRRYKIGEEPSDMVNKDIRDIDEHLAKFSHELDESLREAGIVPESLTKEIRARTLQIMEKEGITDPDVAYEHAVMEANEDAGDQIGQRQHPGPIPGWDVPDVAATAQTVGADAARQRTGGSGGAARQPGATDRAAAIRGFWNERLGKLPDYSQPEALAASRAADKAPGIPEASKRVQAAQKALADAQNNMAYLLEDMEEGERQKFEDETKILDERIADTEQVIGNAAACMTASGYA